MGLGGGWSLGKIPGISGPHPHGLGGSYPKAYGVNYGSGNFKIGAGAGKKGYVGVGLSVSRLGASESKTMEL